MNDPVNQMAAMSAALRMLLADHPLRKPVDLRIAASNAMTPEIISMMMSSVAAGHATFLALFDVGADTAFLNRVMIVEGSTARQQINIGAGKFVGRQMAALQCCRSIGVIPTSIPSARMVGD